MKARGCFLALGWLAGLVLLAGLAAGCAPADYVGPPPPPAYYGPYSYWGLYAYDPYWGVVGPWAHGPVPEREFPEREEEHHGPEEFRGRGAGPHGPMHR